MSQSIHTGNCSQPLGQLHYQFGVDNCHAGSQCIIGKRELLIGFFVRNNCKRSDFRSSSTGGRNGNQHRFFAERFNFNNTFLDIHKAHCNVFKADIRLFIHQPHDFSCIDRRSTADRNDHICIKAFKLLKTFVSQLNGRVGCNIAENVGGDAHIGQGLQHRSKQAGGVEEFIGDNEGAFLSGEIFDRSAETAVFEVDFGRYLEPKHIFSPFRDGFDVQKVHGTNVFRNIVSAPAATSESKRRIQGKVVKVTDCTMRCRRVDNDPACQHHMTKLTNAFFILGVGVKHRSVTKAAIFQQSFCIVNGLFVGINLIEGQCGRKFFSGERDINTDTVDFCNQSFCISRNLYSCKFCNGNGSLTNDLCIEFSVNLDHIANCFRFFCIENITTALDKFFLHRIVNGSHDSYRLFRSTDHTIVKSFGKQNTADCHFNIAGIIKNNRSIAGTDTNSRSSAGIGCLNHTRSASCKDQRNVFMAHKITTHCNSRLVDPSDDVLRSSSFYCGIQHDFGGETGAFFCTRVRTEYDTVTSFECAKSFEDGS